MRTKSFRITGIALASFSMLCLFASCSSEDIAKTDTPTGPQTLSVVLDRSTRAAVYTDPGTTAENTINRVTIGIFGSDNNVKTIQDATLSGANNTTAKITTSQLAVGDQVLVAVNAKVGTFTGSQTVSDFEGKTLAIDDALAGSDGSATTVANTKLPMFGVGSIAGTSPDFTADVKVYHMVAKITLKSLSVNFDANGAYSNATFTPTEVFMSNVPDKLDFYPAATVGTYTFASTSTFCTGWTDASASNPKAYLGTTADFTGLTIANATLSGATGGSTCNWVATSNFLFLYTMPNSNATTTPTRLVIKGDFKADATQAGDPTTVYYPVNINYNSSGTTVPDGGTTSKVVYPNQNYIVDVTIQGKGSDSPTTPIDPQTATATITPQDFTAAGQSNVFN
jgi:hypothetical protein